MKKFSFILLILLFSMSISGCNNDQSGSSVDDPPEFVEMYLDDAYALTTETNSPSSSFHKLSMTNLEETDDTEPPLTIYDDDLYSETDFEVIVVTNGQNYDLLYSVEVTDSLLGTCVYTNQSTLYVATSTIIVEADESYTTNIVLTIPGSTELDTYLSDRTISITKILFSRDTVDGTFPADIPENSTTSLLFQIHALNYFDTDLGLPLSVDGDNVDIILDPNSVYYSDAETLAKPTLIIPETINGYTIGKIFLKDLSWITEIEIYSGNQDIFILGDFLNLTSIKIDGPEFETILGYKNLTINGDFQKLETIEINDLIKYSLYLSYNNDTDNQTYLDYESETDALYSFPLLESIDISDSTIFYLKIGADNLDIPFSSLISINIDNTFISSQIQLGFETNDFPKLEEVNIINSNAFGLVLSGTKPITETPATLLISNSTMSFIVQVSGSLISNISIDNSTIGDITIRQGTINDSVFSDITITTTSFYEDRGNLTISGSHPNLSNLLIDGITLNHIQIGSIESVFSNLTDLTISNVTAYRIIIGERDVDFSSLLHLSFLDVSCDNFIKVSGENADFSGIEDITITDVSASSILLGDRGEDFSGVKTIICTGLSLEENLTIYAIADFTSLEEVVLDDVTSTTMNISPRYAMFDLYVADSDFTNLYLNSGCQKIYVLETDVTTWDFYTYATENSIPVETGTYNPS
jgi:hypothetical protein